MTSMMLDITTPRHHHIYLTSQVYIHHHLSNLTFLSDVAAYHSDLSIKIIEILC